jgi:inner membrane protein
MNIRGQFSSVFWRGALIGGLVLLLLWPLARVESLVAEREAVQTTARDSIAALHGGPQTIGGPMLRVPTEVLVDEWNPDLKHNVARWVSGQPRWILPETLKISTHHTVKAEVRGIYSLPVYSLPDLDISGEFPASALSTLIANPLIERALWSQASVVIPFGSLSSLQAVNVSDFAGRTLLLGSGSYDEQSALSAPLDMREYAQGGRLPYHFAFRARGSGALHFLPVAGATQVTVLSTWPHPGFEGSFAADHSTPSGKGFEARWQVLEINRNLPRSWSGKTISGEALFRTAFGFSLVTPVDVYSMSYRATRYGVLFIAITFLAFFAWEQVTQGLRLHAMHYLLVGLALSVFFLLLLAIGEHLPFALAYGLAATALILLLGLYVAGVTSRRAAAVSMSLGLAGCYGCLYLILQSEDYALLLGSLLVFTVLAVTMLATRRLNWSQVRPAAG